MNNVFVISVTAVCKQEEIVWSTFVRFSKLKWVLTVVESDHGELE
jgi:hypothetical protein